MCRALTCLHRSHMAQFMTDRLCELMSESTRKHICASMSTRRWSHMCHNACPRQIALLIYRIFSHICPLMRPLTTCHMMVIAASCQGEYPSASLDRAPAIGVYLARAVVERTLPGGVVAVAAARAWAAALTVAITIICAADRPPEIAKPRGPAGAAKTPGNRWPCGGHQRTSVAAKIGSGRWPPRRIGRGHNSWPSRPGPRPLD